MLKWLVCIAGVWLLFGAAGAALASDYRAVGWRDFAAGPISMGRELQRKFPW